VIDHIGMPVRHIARATEFYLKALAPLGISIVMEVSAEESGHGAAVGFGANWKPFFWIGEAPALAGGHVHIAFAAENREAVDAFYRAALAAGAKDNGPPGLRPHYHAN
jgi:catechol 2,3-dioxygenase-like lactoylglutathione lyase family enzyme